MGKHTRKSCNNAYWNRSSACLDLSNPKTQKWFKERLDYLGEEIGVDGFKFDAGDAKFYADNVVSFNSGNPNDQTSYFAELGLNYPLNEYRASWKMAGLPLVQRLRDKAHNWEDLQTLIPDQISQSVMGYTYTCPYVLVAESINHSSKLLQLIQESVVRSAQVEWMSAHDGIFVAP